MCTSKHHPHKSSGFDHWHSSIQIIDNTRLEWSIYYRHTLTVAVTPPLQQFPRAHFDLSRSPVPISSQVLQTLRSRLHRYKKCFSGKEFVDKVLEIGRHCDLQPEPSSQASTPTNLIGRAGISPSGQPVEYTVRYATQLAQFLLTEAILLELPGTDSLPPGEAITPVPSTDDEASLGASYEHPDIDELGLSSTSHSSLGSQGRQRKRQTLEQQAVFNSYRSHRSGSDVGLQFSNSKTVFYKFAGSEDAESNTLYQSHILAASSVSQASSPGIVLTLGRSGSLNETSSTSVLGDDNRDFTRARQGTLFLVYDLLVQRSKKERRAKQFLQLPRAVEVVEQRRQRNVNCDFIFRM